MENTDQPQYQPQPQPLTPTPQPVQPQYQQQVPQPNQNDPGKTLGIVGFVFAFVGLQLVGLILSIIGFNKSKKAGFKNTLAFVGIILNAVFLVLGTLIVAFFIAVTFVSYNGINSRANSSSAQAAAATVIKWTEIYQAENGTYPTNFSQLNSNSSVSQSSTPILFEPNSPSEIEFHTCGEAGNKVGYFDYAEKEVVYMYSGEADSSTQCIFSES